MSFGRKGVAPGQAVAQHAGFGTARPAMPQSFAPEPMSSLPSADDEMERRRQAFIASERARKTGVEGAAPAPAFNSAGSMGIAPAPIGQPPARAGAMPAPMPATRTVFIREKSMMVAYALWFFACQLGAHRFYLGRPGSAAGMVCLWLGSIVTILSSGKDLTSIGVGGIGLIASMIWMVADAFLIPGMVRKANGPRPEETAYAFA